MVKRFKTFDPQLVVVEQLDGSAIALTNEAKLSLYKKSQKSGIPTNVLETVYYRGYYIWNESFGQTPEQFAFDRVNSFVAGGFAADLDDDLIENWQNSKYKNPEGGLTQAGVDAYRREHPGSKLKTAVRTEPSKLKAGSKSANRRNSFCARMGGMKKRLTSAKTAHDPDSRINKALRAWHCEEIQINEKRGLWDNIHAKQERIKNGSGEHMRKPGSKGAPTEAALKASQTEEYTGSDPKSNDPNNPLARMDGTYSGAKTYADATPYQKLAHSPEGAPKKRKTLSIIKKTIREDAIADSEKLKQFSKDLADAALKQKVDTVNTSVGGDSVKDSAPHPATQIPADFASRKKEARLKDPSTGVAKPNINDGIQQRIATGLSKKVGSLQADNAGRVGSSGTRQTLQSMK
jgi:hypothetical protein